MGLPGLDQLTQPSAPGPEKGGLTPSMASDINRVLPDYSKSPGPPPIPETRAPDNSFLSALLQNITTYRPGTQYQQKKEY